MHYKIIKKSIWSCKKYMNSFFVLHQKLFLLSLVHTYNVYKLYISKLFIHVVKHESSIPKCAELKNGYFVSTCGIKWNIIMILVPGNKLFIFWYSRCWWKIKLSMYGRSLITFRGGNMAPVWWEFESFIGFERTGKSVN